MIYLLLFLSSLINTDNEKNILSFTDFIKQVKDSHPINQQIDYIDKQTIAYYQKAKGGLDPKLSGAWDKKSFDKKNYYDKINTSIKVPTPYGIGFKVSYENNDGSFLNNMDILPNNGLLAAGIEIPLGQGLFFDEIRKNIKTANLYEDRNELKKRKIENQLIYYASKAYLSWQESYFKLINQEEALVQAERRYKNIVSLSQNGDKAAIDTLEAYLNLKNRNVQLLYFQQKYNQTTQDLYNYIWDNEGVSELVDTTVIPEQLNLLLWNTKIAELKKNSNTIIQNHLTLNQIEIQNKNLVLERRLAKEKLKPIVNLNYNPLFSFNNDYPSEGYHFDQYKLGLALQYPIFSRKQRANLKLIDLELKFNDNEKELVKNQLTNELQILIEKETFIENQLSILSENQNYFETLFEAEKIKFDIGESSLFLLNNREVKLIENKNKIISKQKELLLNKLELLYQAQTL